MSTYKETTEREFHIINFIDKSLVTFTPDPNIGTRGLLVKGVSVKDSNKKDVFIGLTDGTKFKYLTNDDYDIYYQSSDSIYTQNRYAGTQGWPIYIDLYKENIGITAPVKYSYNGVHDYFFTINYIPYEVLLNIIYFEDIRNVYLFNEELPSSYSVSPNKHIALYPGISGDLLLYSSVVYYDPMNILDEGERSINYYVNKGVITYKSGDPLNSNIGNNTHTRKVTFVNKPYTNKEQDTIEITEKSQIYCYEYSDNMWKSYGHFTFMKPNGKEQPLVYKSVAHYSK